MRWSFFRANRLECMFISIDTPLITILCQEILSLRMQLINQVGLTRI